MRIPALLAAGLVALGCATDPTPPTPATTLERTAVLAHPGQPLSPGDEGKNLVWCATFRMAFDALKGMAGGPVTVAGGDPATAGMVDLLNRDAFPADALDPRSFVARAGRQGGGIRQSILDELREKFGEGAPVPAFQDAGGDGIHAFAYLRTRLPFAIPFDPIPWPLVFGGKKVAAFGMTMDLQNPRRAEILRQVRVLHETGEEHGPRETFVLSLPAAGGAGEVILARIPRGDTLLQTWYAVTELTAKQEGRPLEAHDTFKAPRLRLSLLHRYAGLVGTTVSWKGFSGPVLDALQGIEFRLDEGGAELESHAYLPVGSIPRSYVLDGPFLLALRRDGGAEPYLLLWVADDEWMEPAEGPR